MTNTLSSPSLSIYRIDYGDVPALGIAPVSSEVDSSVILISALETRSYDPSFRPVHPLLPDTRPKAFLGKEQNKRALRRRIPHRVEGRGTWQKTGGLSELFHTWYPWNSYTLKDREEKKLVKIQRYLGDLTDFTWPNVRRKEVPERQDGEKTADRYSKKYLTEIRIHYRHWGGSPGTMYKH